MVAAAGSLLPLGILLSGFASLAYQIVWVRRFAVVLGTTHAAVTLVLAMFLGGLGLGALLAARSGGGLSAPRLARRFLLLELAAAGFAAALPLYLSWTTPLVRGLTGPEQALVPTGVVAAVFLLPAATAMGATLPTLTALSRRVGDRGEASAAGWLYAANTAGAVLGSLAAARLLIPELGLSGASTCGIAANLAAGAVVFLRFRRCPTTPAPGGAALAVGARSGWRPLWRFGSIAGLSGFAAMAAEVGWARLAALLFGPTIYTFACVVTAVILGIALGSAAAGRLLRRRRAGASAAPALAALQLAGAAACAAVAWGASRLVLPVGALVARNADDIGRLLDLQLVATVAALLLPAIAFGATFPFAVAGATGAAARRDANAGRATGVIYAANAAGAVAGALAAGFLLVPGGGIEAALFAGILAQVVAAIAAAPRVLPVVLAGGVAVAAVGATRSWDWEALSGGLYRVAPQIEPGRHRDFLRRGTLRFLEHGAASTVSVKEVAGELSLAIDGKVDATDGADMLTQRMLAHLPLLLHPDPKSVFIVGHGSGVTAGAALRHDVERVTAAEISAEVGRASRLFAASNGAPWEDERFALLQADARNHLMFSPDSFDVVISEPSNPWMSGVSPLFTVEFFDAVRSRLHRGGLFGQWIHLYNLDGESLRTVVGGFTDVFPETVLFVLHDGDALLIGANGPFPPVSRQRIETRIAGLADEIARYGVSDYPALRRWLTAASPRLDAWAATAPRHRDDHPILEFRAPFAAHAATSFRNRQALEDLAGAPPFGDFGPTPAPGAASLAGRAAGVLSAQNHDWALDLALRALDLDPAEPAAAAAVFHAAVAGGRAREGVTAIGAALREVDEDSAAARELTVFLARLHLAAGAPDEAAATLRDGPAALAEDRQALLLSAEVQVERGALDSAEALALAVLRTDPRDAEAAAWLAESSLRRQRREEAAERAAAILAERPATVRALRVRAVALAELGREAEAREAFAALVAQAPSPAFHWANFAAFELASGRPAEAVRLYREAVNRDPTNFALYAALLDAATRAGDGEEIRRAGEVLDSRGGVGGAAEERP